MKILKTLVVLMSCLFVGAASAADITLFYSPTCPHCHHARTFIENELIYVYGDLKVTEVNVMEQSNRKLFMDTLKKCEYQSGGVPVMVVGEKCFQGYADSMQDTIRTAIEIDLTDEQKESVKQNKADFDKDKNAFINAHSDRKDAVSEYTTKKKQTSGNVDTTNIALFGLLILLLGGLGLLLFKKQK